MSKVSKAYIDEWRQLAKPIERMSGVKHIAFDPDILFWFEKKTADIPRWFIELLNSGILKLEAENAELKRRVEQLSGQLWIVWEGEESEGRWRCLMCGAKREGEDDTGPEGVEHEWNCGEEGSTIWAYDRMIEIVKHD